MQKLIKAVVIAALISATSVLTFAWDDVGHKTSAYIAWQQMTPIAREAVIRILRSGPEDSNLPAYYAQYGSEPEEMRKLEYFMLMASWADIVRDRSLDTRYKKYHHSNWHYDDTFWRQVEGRVEMLPKPDDSGQAIAKLIEFDKVMRNAMASDRDKAVAIAWVEHLIGDIHQPLHTSGRVTDLEPKGDQGGNLFLLTPQGTAREQQMNLHWFWDSIVDKTIPLKGDACERDYIASLGKRFMKEYPRAKIGDALKSGDYEAWRKESFELSTTEVFSPDLVRFQMPSEKYKKKAFKIAERRLALAGYRLADVLNQIFTTAAPAPVAPPR